MGTNFYWVGKDVRYSIDPKVHIGKRSAAGMYCWDCGVTLCRGGESQIHMGTLFNHDQEWFSECPVCGQEPIVPVAEGLLELGFGSPRTKLPTGIRSCSSFSWAQGPLSVRKRCLRSINRWRKIVVNKYGEKFTGRQFIEMLDNNCPVEYTRHVGVEFS